MSYLGFVAGAAYSWALEANQDIDVADVVSWHAFRDRSGSLGRVAYDLGEVYRAVGIEPPNSSVLFWILQRASLGDMPGVRERFAKLFADLPADRLRETLAAIDRAITPLDTARSEAPDAELVRAEFDNTARLLRHACRLGLLLLDAEPDSATARRDLAADLTEIIAEYRRIWLLRNRTGGLPDSVGKLDQLLASYPEAQQA